MKVDLIVMRHPNPGAAHFLSKQVDSCIVNAGDGTHEHPSQALLDAYSLQEKLGDLKGRRIAIVGDILHSRVALSNIYALKMLGAEVKLCAPKSLLPKYIESLGVTTSSDLMSVLNWCDAVNMLRVQKERMELSYFPSTREYSQNFGLNGARLKQLRKEIVVLHPGPINRGVEVTSEVADSEQAIILDQVENGVAIRMAIIYLLGSQLNRVTT
jgi:aspartate carbamoyltransferase catalytic subunit